MKVKNLVLSTLISGMLVVFSACGSGGDTSTTDTSKSNTESSKTEATDSSESKVIKLGVIAPLSGDQASGGLAIKNGAQLLVNEKKDEFQKKGFELSLVAFDDKADPNVGVEEAKKIIEDKEILGLVAHYNSGVAVPASEIYKKVDLCMVSPAITGVGVTERGLDNVNRICSRDDVQGPVSADYAFNDLKLKNAFIVNDKTTFGDGVAKEWKKQFEKCGGKVLANEAVPAEQEDYSEVIDKIAQAKADVVYYGGMYAGAGKLLKQMAAKSVNAVFMGPDGIDSADLVKIAGDAVKGAYYSTMSGDLFSTPGGKEFDEKYRQTFTDSVADVRGAYAYDSAKIVLDGILKAIDENSGKTPTKAAVGKIVRATKEFKGSAINVTFNSKGDNETAVVYMLKYDEAKYPAKAVKQVEAKEYLK